MPVREYILCLLRIDHLSLAIEYVPHWVAKDDCCKMILDGRMPTEDEMFTKDAPPLVDDIRAPILSLEDRAPIMPGPSIEDGVLVGPASPGPAIVDCAVGPASPSPAIDDVRCKVQGA